MNPIPLYFVLFQLATPQAYGFAFVFTFLSSVPFSVLFYIFLFILLSFESEMSKSTEAKGKEE